MTALEHPFKAEIDAARGALEALVREWIRYV
jgi:hypothetical protein